VTFLDASLLLAAIVLAAALVAAAVARRRTRAHLGQPVVARRVTRSVLPIVAVAVAMVAVLLARAEPLPLVVVLMAAALYFAAPDPDARVLGRDGIQRGWRSARFEDLAEWRLTGDDLRVLLDGEWEAVPAPAADHAQLRQVLEQRAPGRESRFAH
jgi:hypothetical protein